MADGIIQVAADSVGKMLRTFTRSVAGNTVHEQAVQIVDPRQVTYRGRGSTYRITGRAPATPFIQNLMTIWNPAGNNVLVDVQRIMIDSYSTATRIMNIHPAIVRVDRITAAPSGGNAVVKVPMDTADVTDAEVALLQDASADGTNSTAALAVTHTAGAFLTQEVVPRVASHAATTTTNVTPWMEPADRMEFFAGEPDVTLRAGNGLSLFLQGQAATSIPATDFFVATIDWEEYTLP
jgi:hypothetical protein